MNNHYLVIYSRDFGFLTVDEENPFTENIWKAHKILITDDNLDSLDKIIISTNYALNVHSSVNLIVRHYILEKGNYKEIPIETIII